MFTAGTRTKVPKDNVPEGHRGASVLADKIAGLLSFGPFVLEVIAQVDVRDKA